MARLQATEPIARVVGVVLAAGATETGLAVARAAVLANLETKATRPAHPISSVSPTSCQSVRHSTVLVTRPQPKNPL